MRVHILLFWTLTDTLQITPIVLKDFSWWEQTKVQPPVGDDNIRAGKAHQNAFHCRTDSYHLLEKYFALLRFTRDLTFNNVRRGIQGYIRCFLFLVCFSRILDLPVPREYAYQTDMFDLPLAYKCASGMSDVFSLTTCVMPFVIQLNVASS